MCIDMRAGVGGASEPVVSGDPSCLVNITVFIQENCVLSVSMTTVIIISSLCN